MLSLPDAYEERRELLEGAKERLQLRTEHHFDATPHIDRISFRVKSTASFVGKVERYEGTERAYAEPLIEVEDQLAGRILVFFLEDLDPVLERLPRLLASPLESAPRMPAVDAEFGYESYHEVYSLPSWALPEGWSGRDDLPHSFELQVRTFFQHAWAEPQHDAGYKDRESLSRDQRRELAWVAASAWGADQAYSRLRAALQKADGSDQER